MVGMFENILEQCTENGTFTLNKKEIQLLAHNIFIQGQMWGFRRWALQKLYTLEEYTDMQIRYVLQGPICFRNKECTNYNFTTYKSFPFL